MPEKLGNGGHSYEKYDPNTGKYVTDGQPNKYYDNPKENETINNVLKNSIKLSREELKDYLNNVVQNEELNAMFKENKKYEKYTKPIVEMTKEELLAEIGEHNDFLISKGIDLTKFGNAFIDKKDSNDFRLKCSNFREMHRMMQKYPINMKNCEFIFSNHFSENSGEVASASYRINYFVGFIPNIDIQFNAKRFQNYELTKKETLGQIKIKFHPECSDEFLASQSFIHEFGHCITYDYIYKNNLYPAEEAAYIIESYSKNVIKRKLKEKLYSICDKIKDEVYEIYIRQNSDLSQTEAYNNFSKDTSRYGGYNGAEWFAETFASLECGKPTKSALALKQWLEEKKIKGEE